MNQKKYNLFIILIWITLSLAILFVTHVVTHNKMETLKNHKYEATSKTIQNKVQLLISSKQESMKTVALSLVENTDLKKALLENDHTILKLKEFSHKLNQLTKFKNVWFQVIDKNGYNFYRSWVDKRGDFIKKVRIDIAKMIKEPKVMTSISTGRFDMTFKAMVPIYDNEKFIGIFEVITHFNSIAKTLKQENIDAIFIVDKKYKKQLTKAFTKIFINDYYIANINAKQELLALIKKDGIENYIKFNESYVIKEKINQLITTYNILDIDGNDMGYAILFKPINKAIDMYDINEIHKDTATYVVLLLVILSVIGYFLSNRRFNTNLQHNLKQTKIQEDKVSTIIDSQPSIIIITNGKYIKESNLSFLSFFNQYKTLNEFKKDHDCICDFFDPNIEEDDYIIKKDGWLDLILTNPLKTFKVAMSKENQLHHFIVKAKSTQIKNSADTITIVTFMDITDEVNHIKVQKKHKSALIKVSQLKSTNLDDTLQNTLQITANTLNISRISIWLFNKDESAIECLMLFIEGKDVSCSGVKLKEIDYPNYFKMIKSDGLIIAGDAQNDINTQEFANDYLKQLNIISMLDIPIINQGKIIGVVCNEQVDVKKEWTVEEIEFSVAIANNIALSLENDKRTKVQNELKIKTKEQNTLLSLFDKGDSVLFKWKNDEHWSVEYVSSSIYNLLEYTKEDFTDNKIAYASCIHPDDITTVFEEVETNSNNIKISYFKHKPYRLITKSGQVKWILDYTVILKDENSKITHFLGYITDITDQKEKDRLLFEQSKMASLGELISNIAHQWRQPLSAISGATTGMKLQKELGILTDEVFIENMDRINHNAQYLSQVIENFNDFISDSKVKSSFNLKDEINSFLHLIQTSTQEQNINIIINLEEEIKIDSYKSELMQCLINMFNNSSDAFKNNNIEEKYIFITAKKNENKITILFKDNAGGIPDEILPKIFEPYFTTKHQSQGTGLGLHLIYNLVTDVFKGDIEVINSSFEYNNKNYLGAEYKVSFDIN